MENKKYSTKILTLAKKIKAIEYLGGKCEICGDDNIFHLIFHHPSDEEKENTINSIRALRWTKILNEIKKCKLLCNNCHRELHKKFDNDNSKFNFNKRIFLDFKNIHSCSKCGYNKYTGALNFHHNHDKIFQINRIMKTCISVDKLSEYIIEELNKCEILCANCHQEKHTDKTFFEKNKMEIFEKAKTMKEKLPKISRELVRKMYFEEGNRQIDIVNFFGCKKSTISDIIKNLKTHQ